MTISTILLVLLGIGAGAAATWLNSIVCDASA